MTQEVDQHAGIQGQAASAPPPPTMSQFEPPNPALGLPGFAPGVRDAIYRHVYSDTANEVGGILAGDVRADGTVVVGAIPASSAEGDVTSLTFTHESWMEMLGRLEASYPGAAIVGWYHSHPGHGVFLSAHDRFIHQNFFPAAWQVAIVVDPHHHTEGLFMWREGELPLVAEASVDARWVGAAAGEPEIAPAPVAEAPPSGPRRSARPPRQRREVPAALRGVEAAIASGAVAGIALGLIL